MVTSAEMKEQLLSNMKYTVLKASCKTKAEYKFRSEQ